MGPYAAQANCDVDHYLTNCVHRGCTDSPRLSFYSGARSRILFSVTAPFNPAAAMCPPSAIRLRWASSQWRPSNTQPTCQPNAITTGFEGKRNPRDLFTGPD